MLAIHRYLHFTDNLVIANCINLVSDGALAGAINKIFGIAAAGEAVPYLSYALAVRNFEYAANEESFRSVA